MPLATDDILLSAEPILAALANYRGSVIDLDQGRIHGPASLARDHATLATALTAIGVRPGDRVVMAVGNGPGFLCLLTALLSAGAAPLLLHVKTPPLELRRTAMRFGASWIIADAWAPDELEGAHLPAKPLSDECLQGVWWHRVDECDEAFDGDYPSLSGVPLHPTSGTTGLPKVAVRPGAAAVAEARHYIETIGIEPSDTILAATPMSHAYAYGMAVMAPLLAGCKVATTRGFEAAVIRRALAEKQATILPAVPAMLDLLTFGAGDRLRQTARCVLSAGAPLPERTARRFFDCTGIHVRPLYGTTETGGISVGPDGHGIAAGGYVGPAMRGVEASIRHESTGEVGNIASGNGAPENAQSPDDLGRLYIRSSSMMAGYLGRDGIDTSPIIDGWFLTGDLATQGSSGGIHLKGRHSEVINVGGLKVIPCEVEEVIAGLPGVLEVKVYAGHDRKGRQSVKAAVVVEKGIDSTTIQEHCETHLVYYKRPHTVALVEQLPRGASGKIVISQLP